MTKCWYCVYTSRIGSIKGNRVVPWVGLVMGECRYDIPCKWVRNIILRSYLLLVFETDNCE